MNNNNMTPIQEQYPNQEKYPNQEQYPKNYPSLCIPRVNINTDEKQIRKILTELNIGIINRVDIISKKTTRGEIFNRVYIHFNKWFSGEIAINARERLLSGKDIKIIYEDPWYWKITAYKNTK